MFIKKIINSKDWSASREDFKLASLVLNENFSDSYNLMEKIGENGEVKKENYMTWPLFTEIRKKQKFKETFKKVFKEEYSVLEIPKRPIHELIEEQEKDSNKKTK